MRCPDCNHTFLRRLKHKAFGHQIVGCSKCGSVYDYSFFDNTDGSRKKFTRRKPESYLAYFLKDEQIESTKWSTFWFGRDHYDPVLDHTFKEGDGFDVEQNWLIFRDPDGFFRLLYAHPSLKNAKMVNATMKEWVQF